MYFLNLFQPGSLRRHFSRSVFALCVLVCFSAALLLTGCPIDDDERANLGFIPEGEWEDDWGGEYIITNTILVHDSGFFGDFSGTIEDAIDFLPGSGVLIIRITESTMAGLTIGKYTGVYYKDYTASHVFLANAVDESFDPIEVDTLSIARGTFNVDKVDNHVPFWGTGYNRR